MSCTTIYKIEKNGDVIPFEDIKNAHRVSMTIWEIMYKTYNQYVTDKIERPAWMPESEPLNFGYLQIIGQMDPFWGLFKNKDIERNDRLVFGFTFDYVIVRKKDIPELIEAHKEFIQFYKGNDLFPNIDFTGLEAMVRIMEELVNDKECIGLATCISLIASHWVVSDEDSEDERPYNIFTKTKHWNLFNDTNQIDHPKVGDKLYLDDDIEYRTPPDDTWVRIYSYDEFVAYIEANGLPEAISFDHDLGSKDGIVLPTGKDCANWLVAYCIEKNLDLPQYDCHSANPCGWDNIKGLLDNYKKFRTINND